VRKTQPKAQPFVIDCAHSHAPETLTLTGVQRTRERLVTHRGMIMLDLRIVAASVTAALALSACGNSGAKTGSGLSTASILGEAPAAASGESPGITKADPMARPVQVAWTAARAEKCGFNFDGNRLKTNYLAFEQAQGADAAKLGNITKSYDMTMIKIKGSLASQEGYCTDKKSALIKADLQRHLAGNYEPNFPEDKKSEGNFFTTANDTTKQENFNPKTIWRDLEDKKNGTRRSGE
jgi:hypothetical protein